MKMLECWQRVWMGVALATLVAACTASTSAPSPTPLASPVADAPADTPVVVADPPEPGAPAGDPALPQQNPPPQASAPKVTVARSDFAIGARTGSLVRVPVTPDLEAKVKFGLNGYLTMLDAFRKNGGQGSLWSPPKPFGDIVARSLRETIQPGIERQFELISVRIDAAYRKPWGADAMADVTVTIRDKVLKGNVPEDSETGRLRLAGENRFNVIDGWDATQGRWVNGIRWPSRDLITNVVEYTVANYLWSESWVPGGQNWSYSQFWGLSSTFAKWHDASVATFDRGKIVSRTFDQVSAEVERFDPSTELGDGLALVRFRGTEILTDASGATQRSGFERRVRVFLPWWGLSNGRTVIVDEFSGGTWRSGGDLALKDLDHEFG